MKNNLVLENLISFCDEMTIAEEGLKDIKNPVEKEQLKFMRKVQVSKFGIANANITQKNLCKKKLDACKTPEDREAFLTWLDKQKRLLQKKINGTEIKDKKGLQKMMSIYNEYISKVNSKKASLGSKANESFFDLIQ